MIDPAYALSQEQPNYRQRLRGRLMLLWVTIVLAGCTMMPRDNLPNASTVQPTVAGTILPFTTIAQGDQLSGSLFVNKPQIIIIANSQDVNVALRQATGDPAVLERTSHQVEQARQIDYTRSFAILVLQGWQGSSGYSIAVDQLMRQGDRVQVLATFVRPGEDGSPEAHSAVITDPYHLISIPKTGTWGQDVRFELVDKGKVVAETTHFIP